MPIICNFCDEDLEEKGQDNMSVTPNVVICEECNEKINHKHRLLDEYGGNWDEEDE